MDKRLEELVQTIAEELQGSCKNLDTVLEEHGETMESLPFEFFHTLDDITMQCTLCDWWVESGEVDDDGLCGDCQESEDD